MSTLSLDPAVSLSEPATRPAAVATTAARMRAARPAPGDQRDERHGRHGRHSTRPQATHARRTSAGAVPGLAVLVRTAHLVAVRALGTSLAAAAVTWALTARSTGDGAALATSSLRGLAAAAVICAAWGFQDRARLGALDATRIWYATASLLAV